MVLCVWQPGNYAACMIELRGISVKAGEFSLANIDLRVESRTHAVLMGPTGAGKTSLLEVICGLMPTTGQVLLSGRDATRLAPSKRGVGYVPQDNALFEHMTVSENLAYALRRQHRGSEEITARVNELAEQLGLIAILQRFPKGLSGGEQKRVALGRALAAQPAILLMDEPLAGLDQAMAETIRPLLQAGLEGTTVLHVTHDPQAAERADCCFELREGQIIAAELNRSKLSPSQ